MVRGAGVVEQRGDLERMEDEGRPIGPPLGGMHSLDVRDGRMCLRKPSFERRHAARDGHGF